MEETLAEALRVWVRDAASFDDEKVIFSEENTVRPPVPFITLRIGTLTPLGAADELVEETDLDGPAGQEITQTIIGRRSLDVSIQCFGRTKKHSAMKILSLVQLSLSKESVQSALDDAGVSVFDTGTVQNTTGLLETEYESRALLEIECYVTETDSDTTTFIESAEVTNEVSDAVIIIEP